jgi:small-conductance mechanosensitive channel
MNPERLLTLRDAAEATGSTVKAMRSRAERGSLRTVKRERGGQLVRLVPRSELIRSGLLARADDDERTQANEASKLREQIATLTDDLTAARALTEKAQGAEAAERAAHEQTRQSLHETRADAKAQTALVEELREREQRLAQAGWRERRRLLRDLRDQHAA